MYSLKSVDCIFQFFCYIPQFVVVKEYTFNICIECSDFDCVADCSAIKNMFSVLKASIARIVLRLMSFSVSSRLPSNLHFFHFSLPCRIISYSVLDSLITRLRCARVDGVDSLICYPLLGCGCRCYIICIISVQFRNSFLFLSFGSSHDLCGLRVRYFHTDLQRRSYVHAFSVGSERFR